MFSAFDKYEQKISTSPNKLSIPKFLEKEVKRHSIHGITESIDGVKPHQEIVLINNEEKRFLLAVERGDTASVKRILHENFVDCQPNQSSFNMNCVDPLGRSAILMAIDNENFEMLRLLLDYNISTKDALLYAISEEFVEAVELLLDWEECKRQPGEPHSWECRPYDTKIFTADITPLILAAHRDNYEIIKILLDKGARLPVPHDNRCDCANCIVSLAEDSLQYSHSRINAYRALSSPCLIALSSKDPILTVFDLSYALHRLSILEHEFKSEYETLNKKCQKFAIDLLDHTRTSAELEILLNFETQTDNRADEKTMRLDRLKLAIKMKQKEFVVHPNVQQLLASIWYEGLPGFRRKNALSQTIEIIKIGILFPVLSIIYILAPYSWVGIMFRTPFIKFICHSASYFFFLFLLIVTSLDSFMEKYKNYAMISIAAFVFGLMWNEIKQLWREGLGGYIKDMWNAIDFVTTALYLSVIGVRIVCYNQLTNNGTVENNELLNRPKYDKFHPQLVSEALFSTANIFSTLKLVYIFSINPFLGPIQIVLGRVIMDIAKFFLLYVLVLFAFSNGLHHLLAPYAQLQEMQCNNNTEMNNTEMNNTEMCDDLLYKKFANLFETTQTLFWSAFGVLGDLKYFVLYGINDTTKFWGMLMFGSYCVISIVVLLNLLIAMMNHSYEKIFEDADVAWKFARSKLWISYFEHGGTAPVPFNIIPSPKTFWYILKWIYRIFRPTLQDEELRFRSIQMSLNEMRYRNVMRNLVQRYIIARQKKGNEHFAVSEDDINELKQEITSFRSELIEILRESGMKTNTSNDCSSSVGKKNREKARRILKGISTEFVGSRFQSQKFIEVQHERSLSELNMKNTDVKYSLSDLLQPISIFRTRKLKNMFLKANSKIWKSTEEFSKSDAIEIPTIEHPNKDLLEKRFSDI